MTVMLQLVIVTPLQVLEDPLVMMGTAPEMMLAPMAGAGAGAEAEAEAEAEDGVVEEQE